MENYSILLGIFGAFVVSRLYSTGDMVYDFVYRMKDEARKVQEREFDEIKRDNEKIMNIYAQFLSEKLSDIYEVAIRNNKVSHTTSGSYSKFCIGEEEQKYEIERIKEELEKYTLERIESERLEEKFGIYKLERLEKERHDKEELKEEIFKRRQLEKELEKEKLKNEEFKNEEFKNEEIILY